MERRIESDIQGFQAFWRRFKARLSARLRPRGTIPGAFPASRRKARRRGFQRRSKLAYQLGPFGVLHPLEAFSLGARARQRRRSATCGLFQNGGLHRPLPRRAILGEPRGAIGFLVRRLGAVRPGSRVGRAKAFWRRRGALNPLAGPPVRPSRGFSHGCARQGLGFKRGATGECRREVESRRCLRRGRRGLFGRLRRRTACLGRRPAGPSYPREGLRGGFQSGQGGASLLLELLAPHDSRGRHPATDRSGNALREDFSPRGRRRALGIGGQARGAAACRGPPRARDEPAPGLTGRGRFGAAAAPSRSSGAWRQGAVFEVADS